MTYVVLVPPIYYNVKQYGAVGDGSTDDTVAIANARAAASVTGGIPYYPPGTYLSGNQTIYPNVCDMGAGVGTTTIRLKNGANTDLFSAQTSSINLSASFGAGSAGSVYRWGISHMTLDGNKANQSSGTSYPIRAYSYNFILEDLEITNGYSGGILSDWNGGAAAPAGTGSMESRLHNVKADNNNGIGIQWGGPHDSQWDNVIVWSNGSHDVHLAPNCGGMQLSTCHFWGTPSGVHAVPLLLESSNCVFTNVVCEGGDLVQFVLLGSPNTLSGCYLFGNTPYSTSGLQIGQQAGQTVYPSQIYQSGGTTSALAVDSCKIEVSLWRCEGTNGGIWFANDNGNMVQVQAYFTTGNFYGGTPDTGTQIYGRVNGISPDGTAGKGGWLRLPINSTQAFLTTDRTGNDIFNIDTKNKHAQLPNGTDLILYSDAYSTRTISLAGGTTNLLQSTTSPDPGAAGTITTSGVGITRVTPAAARTGIILQAGTRSGQQVWVVNESTTAANSITFNTTPGTSNIANAATASAINGGQGRRFVWTGAFWFPST